MELEKVDPAAAGKAPARSLRQVLFVVAILASAFLIFLVQPMVGKRILPWFGGVPSVWTLCLAFYQTTLFLGYAYAHCLIRYARPNIQFGVHTALVLAAFAVLPVLPGDRWKPTDAAINPSLYIFEVLASNVALPFLVLASTGPLVQAWFARAYPDRSPYPLYAVSNIGSFAALLAYPFLLEPRFSLSSTATAWSYAFAATATAVLCCAWVARHKPIVAPVRAPASGAVAHAEAVEDRSDRLTAAQIALWWLLSGCAVVLLMGATNSVCLDTASVPFLWVMPLAVYLLTFILCFSSERVYRPLPYILIFLVALVPTMGLSLIERLGYAKMGSLTFSVYVQIPAYCAIVFGGCMVMHGELYRLRPNPRSLTAFYLSVSGGGALGGIAVGLLAPVLLEGYYELRVGIVLAIALFLAATALAASAPGRGGVRGLRWSTLAPLSIILAVYMLWPTKGVSQGVVYQERSFFSVLRVLDLPHLPAPQRHLLSGTTLHGVQLQKPNGRYLPTTYYGQATGIGFTLLERPVDEPMKVGIVGLGIGTLAAYGRPGDSFRFYEIDSAVVRVARDSGFFSYLSDSHSGVEMVVGDARLAIADEQAQAGSQEFDYLIVDAFSSDAIPVHLMTREAFSLYAKSLSPDGILAVHVSSRHFDLMPLAARAGFEVGLDTLSVSTGGAPRRQSKPSLWLLMSPDASALDALGEQMQARAEANELPDGYLVLSRPSDDDLKGYALWTDDYSDLFGALKPK